MTKKIEIVNCELCGCKLSEKQKDAYGKPGNENYRSRHHYFPKRFRKFFSEEEAREFFKIPGYSSVCHLCYNCHEELVHNIILSPDAIKKLAKKMKGEDVKTRIKIFAKILN
ncbi:hypothetical protein L6260_02230 [Candidatus Parcubacteria bacterium]|nr:hypothetical protein [Candidatus Parcubacteria bacterium]